MRTDIERLRRKIVEKNTTQEAIADSLGIARSTFYRKMKVGGKAFTIQEVHKIVEAVPLSAAEAIEIFLAD